MITSELQRLLSRVSLVRHFYCYETIDSTMDQARRLVSSAYVPSSLHGTLVLAGLQTAGRGRHGRQWAAPSHSSILATLILARRELPEMEEASQLSLVAAALPVAVCNGIRKIMPQTLVKYPNDIVKHGRKVGGVLLETCSSTVLAGFGVNCTQELQDFPPDLKMPATSIFLETGKRPRQEQLVHDILVDLQRLLQPESFYAAGEEMSALCETLGKTVVLNLTDGRTVEGVARRITPEGLLMLENAAGAHSVHTAQVIRTWTAGEEDDG